MTEKAPVNKILPFSVVDGPGSRSTLFLQGCNFHCAYCHNPETQQLCNNCGVCVPGCPAGALSIVAGKVVWDEQRCALCDSCIKTCDRHSSPRVRMMTAGEAYAKMRASIPFIRGITVSGGECTLYPDFLLELFRLAKSDGLSCLMDSNGAVDLGAHEQLVDISDGVMLDIKSWDSETHRALTGCDNAAVRRNLIYLVGRKKITELRIVCLQGEVDAETAIDGIAATLAGPDLHDLHLKLIRFRRFGVQGRLADTASPSLDYMRSLAARAAGAGIGHVLVV